MTKKAYRKPATRVVRLQPCGMLAQSGGGAVRGVNGEWNFSNNMGDER